MSSGMSRDRIEDVYPLSPLQEGILFHSLVDRQADPYFRQVSYELLGPLDAPAFERAWQAVMDRHSALRAAFVWEKRDEPRQVVFRKVKLPFEVQDWREISPDEQADRLSAFLEEDRRRGFQLSRAPLLRLALLRLDDEVHRFVWSHHHLLLDGWSVALVLREVAALYQAFRQGRELELEPSPAFGDYIVWLREQDSAEAEAFWRHYLRGFASPTPVEAGSVASTATSIEEEDVEVGPQAVAALRSLLGRHGLTFNTLVHGAWALLLNRQGGGPDVVFGAVFSGRPAELPGVESMVGLLINTLPVRVRVEPEALLPAWLQKLQRERFRLHRYEHTPLVEIQRWSEVERGRALFESLVIFENFPRDTAQGGEGGAAGLRLAAPRSLEGTNYPVTLLAEVGDSVRLRLAWDGRRFPAPAMQGMLRRLRGLLEAIAADLDRRLDDLPLLTSEESHQLLAEWNDSSAPPPDLPVHRAFEEVALRRPDAAAVVSEDRRVTYGELNRAADHLAGRLRALGVGPETLVGVFADSSPETVAGLLAILKAGGAYVPLDLDYPRERLAFMIEDSRVPLLLTRKALTDRLPSADPRVVLLDGLLEAPASSPRLETPASELAYVIYTSGSTGRPKGVQVPHGALAGFLASMRERPGFGAGDRLLAVTPLSFDIAGLELFLPLTSGGELHLVRREVARDGARLLRVLRERRIDMLQATPSTWQLLVEAGWEAPFALAALCGGEALPVALARRLARLTDRVWNLYGPTETTIWSAVHRVEEADGDGGWALLGRPIRNTSIHVLDPLLRPVPAGVPGELCIGGAGVARGYLGRPDLTAERFVPDPFALEPGARIYRTGDLARFRSDGRLEFLGRLDHQVKIRGHRIELGEVEAALGQIPGVREAVAVAREEAPGDWRLVAYLTGDAERLPDLAGLRALLRDRLPEPMLPSALVCLEALPRTPNGKVDRKVLPAPGGQQVQGLRVEPASDVERTIAKVWSEVLRLDQVPVTESFFDLGGHSLLLMRVRNRLQEVLGLPVELLDLFRHPTVESLAWHLAPEPVPAEEEREPRRAALRRQALATAAEIGVAVVGMAGRFPGARNLDELWANLRDGVEAISFFSDEELREAGISEETLRDPSYVRAKGVLEDAEWFDAAFFSLLPREAELMDPQHRVFLECAWEALENAGCDPMSYPGAIGVYAGTSLNSYAWNLPPLGPTAAYQAILGNDKDYLPTRLSYKLNLRGPSIGVQTACSTSLVAVHMAAQSLLYGECDMALAGGVSVTFPRKLGYFHSEGMIVSPDGHCRAFDAAARGTVFGEGVGVVVLKRLADALADRDTIHAVIRGSAVNNDGSAKVGYTAPSVEGQARAISEALEVAGIGAETVTYVEAHGTGTPLGDPIEVAALTQVFRAATDRRGFCALGSIKTNLGHMDAAAGIGGFLKTVLCLARGVLPPSLHFERPNPNIDFAASPFFVNAAAREWRTDGGSRRAGVSSFGIGGTNAHVVLEEAPPLTPRPACEAGEHLLVLSARTPAALERSTDRLAAWLDSHPEASLDDVAWTLQSGRRAFEHRRMLVCRDREDAVSALEERQPGRVSTAAWSGGERPVVLLFPGQGAQRPGMGLELYRSEPVFRAGIDRCAEILEPRLGIDLRRLLFPEPGESGAAERLRETAFAQPALFALEHSLAALLRSRGIRPRAMIGHSIGEYVAACLAGVFSLEDALALVTERGRLMSGLPAGSMLDVALPEAEVRGLLGTELSLAAVNAPARCVVSGPAGAVEELERRLLERGVVAKRVRTSHAFHSRMMEPILEPFRRKVEQVRLRPPASPFLSNLTGAWIRDEEATDPGYWVRHLRQEVRFCEGIAEILTREPDAVLLEAGPGETLTALLRQQPGAASHVAFSVLPARGAAASANPFLETLGRLWLAGAPVRWEAPGRGCRRIPLPTYPFERQRHSLQVPRRRAAAEIVATDAEAPVPVEAPAPVPGRSGEPARRETILATLHGIVRELSGLSPERLDPRASFLELGVDSLLLIQFTQAIQAKLGIQVPVTLLLEKVSTLHALVEHLDRETPAREPEPEPERPVRRAGEDAWVPYQAIEPGSGDELTPLQRRSLARLVESYTARTRESKRRTDAHRPVFADNRASVDFRMSWKELIYPLIGERSAGSRLRDVDGNEYIDLAMGFGVHLFGHAPELIQQALREQMAKGLHLGPQSELAGEVAEAIAGFTGLDRVAFSNTGTEAVMTAMRLARAATGRSRIALFAGSYHGSFDGVLARPRRAGGDPSPMPMAPGVPAHFVDDVLVLPYGDPAAFDLLRASASDLAAVLVEPVQSRRPDLQPREFLHELRDLTRRLGAALIFDEVITGFRIDPGGCQAWFGVEADIATYGKVLGGGMPLGVVAGRSRYLDAIDGGGWRYGDRSYPKADKTFFAGTFCKHPLSMAAARAVLQRFREEPGLQAELNRRTAEMTERLDAWFESERLPVRMARFGSLFRFVLPASVRQSVLFYYHLAERGVFTWEGRTCFLSTAHTDADVEAVVAAVCESALAMRDGGFFPEGSSGSGRRREPEPPAATVVELPATAGQRQLWLLAQMDPDASRAYNLAKVLRFRGDLRVDDLARAFQRVVDRHDALRTGFAEDGERRRVVSSVRVELPRIDLSGLPEVAREAARSRLLAEEGSRGFDLSRAPLVRAALIDLGDGRRDLALACHHSVVDGRSLGVLLADLEAFYENRQPPAASEPAAREADGGASSLDFWLRAMAPPVPVLELPCDRPRPARHTHRGGHQARTGAADFLNELRRTGTRSGSTLFMTLLGAWCVLLHRLSGQDDLIVGVPSGEAEADGAAMGYDLNLLPIRAAVAPERPFSELTAALRRAVLEGQVHRDFSLTDLLRELGLRPGRERLPLIAAVFNLDRGRAEARFAGLPLELITNPTGGAKFEVSLNVTDDGRDLLLECEHNADLFRADTVERWLGHYLTLLADIATDPGRPAADLRLLSEAERRQLLVEWNGGSDGPAALPESPVHRHFEARAARTPDAVAVVFEDERLTCRELDERAGALARRLRALGVGPEVRVGVFLERSAEMLVAVLAVWKAGGAYVPLDPAYPSDRLAFVLADAGLRAVLTRSSLRGELGFLDVECLCLDELMGEPGSAASGPEPLAGNLAYVIYTSGSTGRPKGVAVEHRHLASYLAGVLERMALPPGASHATVSTLAADLGNTVVFAGLVAGGTVHVISQERLADGESLGEHFDRHGVDVLKIVPSHLSALLAAARPERALPRRLLILGGEATSWELLDRVRSLAPGCRVLNHYGPTETTVGVLALDADEADRRAATLPLGRPIRGARVHLLDRRGGLVPLGVPGEVHIGGAGVSRGYLGRPGLTAERFVPDPFGGGAGGRLYRTGDLARRLPDGTIEFLGRIDHQIKVRGFRVELGEIEAALRSHPAVGEAVVAAWEEAPGGKALAAYVVPREDASLDPVELRAFLGRVLPDYMVPPRFVRLDALPLTPNGKIDRSALPAPEREPAAATGDPGAPGAPRTIVEEVVAGIWTEVLGVGAVGPRDDFFALGGHSLLAMRVISRTRQAFRVELPMRSLFDRPTLEGLAGTVGRLLRAGADEEAPPPIVPVPRQDAGLPLSFSQQRLWVLDQIDPGSPAYNIPTALRLDGPLDVRSLAATFTEVVRRHGVLRTTFALRGDEAVQIVGDPLPVPLPVIDLAALPEAVRERETRRLASEEARRPFDLERGPVLRVLLLELARHERALLATMHHIGSDGWSREILFREVADLYAAFSQGRPSPLTALTIQYADFAAWQRRWLQGDTLERQLAYWRQTLGGAGPVLSLPADRPRPAARRARGAVLRISLPADLTAAMRALARQQGATLFMVTLAAYQALLSRASGQDDIRVGTPVAGRNRVEVEGLIGFFANTLVLRAEIQPGLDFLGLTARVREAALEAHAHQELPFEKLVAELQADRAMDHTPLFQAMFVMNPESRPTGLRGVRVRPLASATETAKFDVNLELTETSGGLLGTLEYDVDLFDRTTIQRLFGQYERLLAAVVAAPDRPLERVDLLSPEDRRQILAEWNDTAASYDRHRLVHQLFEAQAESRPDAVAVVFQGESLSYAELNRRANRLAHHLRSLGIGRGDLVGVFVPRSIEMIVAVLGVLKAGAAYVPLASSFPPARRRWILSTLGVRVLLTHGDRRDDVADLSLEHVVFLDAADLRRMPEHDPALAAEADDTAYIIFTSGSTGTPKGVEVRHRPVINLIEWVNRELRIGAEDRVLFVTALTFDLSVYDIFGLLAAGGSIHVASEEDLEDAERLFDLLCREPLTLWDSAPAALQRLSPYLAAGHPAAAASRLRHVLLSGDWIPVPLPGAVAGTFPHARVLALGGATEATVWSNFFRVETVDPQWVSIPYGRPIQNARYHVLDAGLNPCAIGVAGDLYIAGECLASGYAAEPALTAWKLLPDPWSPEPGQRMYRTGDRARYWRSGLLEFLGRLDHQVKVRGFRIELGEIETNLTQHPGVRDAVVAVREDRPGQRRLVAYVVPPAGSPEPDAAELRSFLAQRLPEYMVPAAWVALEALPVTPNGKLDRASLPAPREEARASEGRVAPRTPEERLLAGIWAELLGRDDIGVHDRFLELGGDSILSIQVVARAQRAGLRVTARQVYEHETIAALAAAIAGAPAGLAAAEEQGAVTGEVPLMPVQRWLLDRGLADLHHFNQSVLLASRRPLDAARLEAAVEQVIRHHDALRLRLTREDGAWRQRIAAPGGPAPVVRIDLSALPAGALSAAVEAAAGQVQGSLDLAAGPVVRVAVFEPPAGERGRILLVIHHLAVDGVSWRILLEDLQRAYEGLELPPKTASVRRWAERLRELAASPGIFAETGYWTSEERCRARPLPVELDGADLVAGARSVEAALSEDETRALLREVAAAFQAEVNDALLAALAFAVTAWTGDAGVLLDVEGHGRWEEVAGGLDVSRTVGWLTSIHPVYLEPGAGDLPGVLRRVRDQLRAVPGRGVGYGLLRERLREMPKAGIAFNYLGQLDQALPADSPFASTPEHAGTDQSPRQERLWRLIVTGRVAAGRLRLSFGYGGEVYRPETIETLAASVLEALRTLIRQCRSASDLHSQDTEDVYPLSPLQESLLVHGLSTQGSQAGVEQICCTLRGELDLDAFERTWQRILERHPVLRTRFLADGLDRPLQEVRRGVSLPLAIEDWRDLPAAEREARLDAFLRADRERGLELDRAPLLRLSLVRFEDALWQLVWTHHHLILDGWCRVLVLQEVFALYAAFRQGGDLDLPPRRPFRDYIAWLEAQDPAEAEIFWRRTFDGFAGPAPARIDRLPDRRRPESVSGTTRHRLGEAETASLRALGRRLGVTLGTLAQAAWGLLTARYSAAAEAVFGVAVSGRPPDLSGVDLMVGMFVNNLPARLVTPDGEELAPWLQRFQAWQQELRLFEHSALAQVQEWSCVPSGRRLFESLVVFQSYPAAPEREPSASLSTGADVGLALRSSTLETNYPLTLVVEPEESLALTLAWQSRSFDAPTAVRILGHLATLLGEIGTRLGRRLGELEVLTAAERHQLLVELPRGWVAMPGLPLPGLEEKRLLVLDDHRRPVPPGLAGDLWSRDAQGRDERTGLRARWLLSGVVEILGWDRGGEVRGRWVETGEVEALLRRHPSILGAAAAVRRDSAGEEQLVAWIAVDSQGPGRPASAAHLRAFLRETLPEWMVPTRFLFLETLPVAGDGTLDRSALPDLDEADRRSLETARVFPRSALELELVRLWEDLFDLRPLGVRDDFFALGGHSLLAVRLMAHIRSRFGRELPLATLFERPTVEHLALALERSDPAGSWSPLVTLQAGDSGGRAPFFLIHPAGGGVLSYLDLARHMGAGRPVYGLQARGQLRNQEPITRVEDLAAAYLEIVREVQPKGPYRLGGSSFGGYVAFEMARQLEEAGERAGLVALLDTGVIRDSHDGELDPREYLGVLVQEMLPDFAHDLPRDRSLDEQLGYVLGVLRQRERVPVDFGQEDVRRYFDLYWTNILAAHAYRPRPCAGRLVLLRAVDAPDAASRIAEDPTFGWGALALGGVEIHDVPGNHFNLTSPPHVRRLAERLRACLDQTGPDPGNLPEPAGERFEPVAG